MYSTKRARKIRFVPERFREPRGDVIVRVADGAKVFHYYTDADVLAGSPILRDARGLVNTSADGIKVTYRLLDLPEPHVAVLGLLLILDPHSACVTQLKLLFKSTPAEDIMDVVRAIDKYQLGATGPNGELESVDVVKSVMRFWHYLCCAYNTAEAFQTINVAYYWADTFWLGVALRAFATCCYAQNLDRPRIADLCPAGDAIPVAQYYALILYAENHGEYMLHASSTFALMMEEEIEGQEALQRSKANPDDRLVQFFLCFAYAWAGGGKPSSHDSGLSDLLRGYYQQLEPSPDSFKTVKGWEKQWRKSMEAQVALDL